MHLFSHNQGRISITETGLLGDFQEDCCFQSLLRKPESVHIIWLPGAFLPYRFFSSLELTRAQPARHPEDQQGQANGETEYCDDLRLRQPKCNDAIRTGEGKKETLKTIEGQINEEQFSVRPAGRLRASGAVALEIGRASCRE